MRRATIAACATLTAVGGAAAATLPAVEIVAVQPIVPYENTARFRGYVPGAGAGEPVTLQVKRCGWTSWDTLVRTETTSGGHWIADGMMWSTSLVRAASKGSFSSPVTVGVAPRISLSQRGRAWTVDVGAAQYFRGHRARIERFDRSRGRWTLARRVTLRAENGVSTGTAILNVPPGTRLRAVLPKPNACYLRAFTGAVVATR